MQQPIRRDDSSAEPAGSNAAIAAARVVHDAWRALAHPLWLAAVALLLLNDHYLKGAGILPGVVTGKLSDFAGMLVAPALLAALLRLRNNRGWAGAHLAVGVVFAAIKLSPQAAEAFHALMSLTPFPWARIVVDPTDLLVALPALYLSYRALGAVARRPVSGRVAIARVAALAGGYACVATSPSPEPPCDPTTGTNCGPVGPDAQGAFVIANRSGSQMMLHVRPLRSAVHVDCDTMLADPSVRLAPELFDSAQSWLVDAGRALPLESDGDTCSVYLVDGSGLDGALIAWRTNQYPDQDLSTAADENPSDRVLSVVAGATGRAWAESTVIFPAPAADAPGPAASCEVPADTVGVDWTTPPFPSTQLLVAATSAPNGCSLLEFASGQSMYVCLPSAAALFTVGQPLTVTESFASASPSLVVETTTQRIEIGRGALPPSTGVTLTADEIPGCNGSRDECGSWALPLAVWAQDGVEVASAPSGGTLTTTSLGTMYVVRAERLPVCDASCGVGALAGSSQAAYFEWARVTALTLQ